MKFVFSEQFTVDSEQEPWRREGLRVGVYGAPGSTKSYSAAAFLLEPFLEQGGTVVVFQPRAEYQTLKSKYPDVQVVGGPYNQDAPFSTSHPKLYADAVVEQGISMAFYTPDAQDEEKLINFVDHFLDYVMRMQEVKHRPLMVVLEEAHEYSPRTPAGHVAPSWVFNRMVKRCKDLWTGGRKLNIVPVAITQRPQELHFSIRQLSNLSLYGQFSPQDISYVDRECLAHYRGEGIHVKAGELKNLKPGVFLIIHHGAAEYRQRTVQRQTPHGADTPSLALVPMASEAVRKTVSNLSEMLKELLEKQAQEESELAKAKREIKELESQVLELQGKVKLAGDLRDLFKNGQEVDVGSIEGKIRDEYADKMQREMEAASKILRENEQLKGKLAKYSGLEELLLSMVQPALDLLVSDFESKWVTKIAHQVQENLERKGESPQDRTVRSNIDAWIGNPHIPESARKILQTLKQAPAGARFPLNFFGYSVNGGAFQLGLRFLKRNGLVLVDGSSVKLRGE